MEVKCYYAGCPYCLYAKGYSLGKQSQLNIIEYDSGYIAVCGECENLNLVSGKTLINKVTEGSLKGYAPWKLQGFFILSKEVSNISKNLSVEEKHKHVMSVVRKIQTEDGVRNYETI